MEPNVAKPFRRALPVDPVIIPVAVNAVATRIDSSQFDAIGVTSFEMHNPNPYGVWYRGWQGTAAQMPVVLDKGHYIGPGETHVKQTQRPDWIAAVPANDFAVPYYAADGTTPLYPNTSPRLVMIYGSGLGGWNSSAPTWLNVRSMPRVSFDGAQPITGSVSLTGTPTVNANVTFPQTQQVAGTFWQAIQPVSATSLPLPNGAASELTLSGLSGKLPATLGAKAGAASLSLVPATDARFALGDLNGAATATGQQAIVTALGQRLTVDDYRLPNPAAGGALQPKTATNVSSFVASAVPCNFFGGSIIARTTGDAVVWVFLLNRATVPASGSTINMAEVVSMTGYSPTSGGAGLTPDQVPDRFTAGLVVLLSTAQDTYTPVTGVNLPKFIKMRVL